ncbi:MAG: M1 family metallopeptidase [Myxococcota bacterium]|nr:M1 family metallopeptidase [Myxococcales bacterium]
MTRATRSKPPRPPARPAANRRNPKKTRAPRRRRTTRLPADVRPTTVDLHFELDPAQKRFRGEARYVLQLARGRRELELHAADLRLSRVRVRLHGEILKPRVELHPECETVLLRFDRRLPAGSLRLELAFEGRVRSDLRGLYRSVAAGARSVAAGARSVAAGARSAAAGTRSAAAGARSAIADEPWLATQLCPTDARRFFPAFDEPGIKARYRVSVTAPADLAVISNAPVESQDAVADGRRTWHFEPTPPLSSYLLAVAVGPFEASPALRVGTTEIRVHTLPGRQRLAAFAREAAAESLERLERWFDLPHPYPKLDLLALPDFAFGAMENAGAVFFRDSILLLDAADSSAEDRQRTAETIAHELAHMWFGNLVTMAWWNDLWLNESFATWMAYEIVDAWQPDWRVWLEFAHRREQALELDALGSSHPVAPPIRDADEALENFDAITYTKGASVLRMLERYLGRETFREGVRLYVRRHREGCATAADLWHALAETSGERVRQIIAPWTERTGHPLISLRRREQDGLGTIELRQERFLLRPPGGARGAAIAKERWTIPWVGRVGRDEAGDARALRHLLTKRSEQMPGHGAELTWVYGNAGEAGFFRVAHGERELDDLTAHLDSLSPLERIGLVGHQWALARATRAPIERLLDPIAALGREDEPDVLAAVEDVLGRLLRRLARDRGPAVEARLRAWIAVYFGAQVDALGLEPASDDDERTRMRRARVLSIVGGLARSEPVLEHARDRLRAQLEGGHPLSPDLADELARLGALGGDAALQAALEQAVRRASTPQARRRFLLALPGVSTPQALAATLRATLDEALAPLPDRATLFVALLTEPSTAEAAWGHFRRNIRRLERTMPPILLARVAAATAEALPLDRAAEIRAFFRERPLAAGRRVVRQIEEQLAIARRFGRHAGAALEHYLGSG